MACDTHSCERSLLPEQRSVLSYWGGAHYREGRGVYYTGAGEGGGAADTQPTAQHSTRNTVLSCMRGPLKCSSRREDDREDEAQYLRRGENACGTMSTVQ